MVPKCPRVKGLISTLALLGRSKLLKILEVIGVPFQGTMGPSLNVSFPSPLHVSGSAQSQVSTMSHRLNATGMMLTSPNREPNKPFCILV